MTNQEAIRLIRNLPTMCKFTDAYGEPIDSDAYYEAVDMAISAIQAQEEKHSNSGDEPAKRLNDLIFDINPAEICAQIEADNLKKWCEIIQIEMKMAMVQLPCWAERR